MQWKIKVKTANPSTVTVVVSAFIKTGASNFKFNLEHDCFLLEATVDSDPNKGTLPEEMGATIYSIVPSDSTWVEVEANGISKKVQTPQDALDLLKESGDLDKVLPVGP